MQKHRSSSKFSVHGGAGVLSVKQSFHNVQSQPSSSARFDNGGYGCQPSKPSQNSLVLDPGIVLDFVYVL